MPTTSWPLAPRKRGEGGRRPGEGSCVTRREALRWTTSALILAVTPRSVLALSEGESRRFPDDPFKLGVASGDPVADGVVLWTRLAPFPFEPRAVDPVPFHVRWRVATDDRMQRMVASGIALAVPELAHSVHVEVSRLEPRTDYFYQFSCGGHDSPIGHTRTAPRPGDATSSARFTLASCQSYTDGYFSAFRDMATHDLDFILHVGDYVYESAYNDALRRIPVAEARDLWGYRALHAQYKLDPDLRQAHAHCPWLATWDDHEVANDWGGEYGPATAAGDWTARKAAAFQAYYEHMPLRLSARPAHGELRLYGRAVFGDLLELNILDTRQYRHLPACLEKNGQARRWVSPTTCAGILDESRRLLGAEQEKWLLRGLGTQRCRWTVLAQPGVFAPLDMLEDEGLQLSQDGWDGFFATRQRILDVLRQRRIANPISLGGDIHSFYAGHVTAEPLSEKSPPLLTEIVATSISAGGGGEERYQAGQRLLRQQPFATYWDNRWRGYVLNEVTHRGWQADLRKVEDVRSPASRVSLLDRLEIDSARVGVKPVKN
jgi:alkaline phosphatase D